MLRNYAGGVFFLTVLYLSALFGSIFLMGPTLLLLWLRPPWFRSVNDRVITLWLYLPAVSIHISKSSFYHFFFVIWSLFFYLMAFLCTLESFSVCFWLATLVSPMFYRHRLYLVSLASSSYGSKLRLLYC